MEKIDWNYWLKLNKLSNEEMIFLTLGLNPVNIDIDNFMGERYILDKENLLGKSNLEYDKRMRFLKESRFRPFTFFENLSDGGWSNYFSADGNGTQVIKKRFLLWLKNEDMGWELPAELQAYIDSLGKPSNAKPIKPKLAWGLKPLSEIQRMNGYRAVLYQTLQKMCDEGKSAPPTAYEVLDSWRIEFKDQPKDCKIYVLSKSFEYLNDLGMKKTVNAKSLNDAIQRLIIAD